MQRIIYVGAGGFIGSVLRYLVTLYAQKVCGTHLPCGTLAVNVVGAFLIGLILELSFHLTAPQITLEMKLFLTTGLLGGFTTFSTFSYESITLLSDGNYQAGLTNIGLNLLLGLGGVLLGKELARLLTGAF